MAYSAAGFIEQSINTNATGLITLERERERERLTDGEREKGEKEDERWKVEIDMECQSIKYMRENEFVCQY